MTNVSRILALGESKCRILRGLEAPGGPVEAGSDECLEDRVPGGLHVSYSTTSGGSWARHIPRTEYTEWVRLKNLSRVFGGLEVTNVSRILALGSAK